MNNLLANFSLTTNDDVNFTVVIDDMPVAAIVRNEDGTWYGMNDSEKNSYPSPMLAAFADANLSDPAYWS